MRHNKQLRQIKEENNIHSRKPISRRRLPHNKHAFRFSKQQQLDPQTELLNRKGNAKPVSAAQYSKPKRFFVLKPDKQIQQPAPHAHLRHAFSSVPELPQLRDQRVAEDKLRHPARDDGARRKG